MRGRSCWVPGILLYHCCTIVGAWSVAGFLLLLLLLLAACDWRHKVQRPCANARTALGFDTKMDRGGATPPNTRIRFAAVAGQTCSQCSRVSKPSSQWGHVGDELESTTFLNAASFRQCPLRSWARSTASGRGKGSASLLPS